MNGPPDVLKKLLINQHLALLTDTYLNITSYQKQNTKNHHTTAMNFNAYFTVCIDKCAVLYIYITIIFIFQEDNDDLYLEPTTGRLHHTSQEPLRC